MAVPGTLTGLRVRRGPGRQETVLVAKSVPDPEPERATVGD
ncbi:hypothetical protein [Streptomyces sp. NPDC000880]